MKFLIKNFLIFLILLPCSAFATPWLIDYSKSHLNFTATQNGAPVKGEFKKFNADVNFDPNKVADSKVTITVDLGSVVLDYEEIQEALKNSDWFDVAAFPKAIFKSQSIRQTTPNHYVMTGNLTIRDKTNPITIDFDFNKQGSQARVTGKTNLMRTSFDVGRGEWLATDTIKNEILVDFTLVATQ